MIKIHLAIFILLFSTAPLFSQTSFNDSLLAISPKIEIDTTYYASGKIRTISFKDVKINGLCVNSISECEKKIFKTVYQYDECSNLRNITTIYQLNIDPSMNSLICQEPFEQNDFLIKNVKCDTLWIKPVLTLNAW